MGALGVCVRRWVGVLGGGGVSDCFCGGGWVSACGWVHLAVPPHAD